MWSKQHNWRGGVVSAWLMVLVVISSVSGCQQGRTNADFIPSAPQSRDALKIALEAWRAGKPGGPIDGTSPVVHVTDSTRASGQSLDDYEILGEVPGNAPRCFAVKLKLSNPDEERRERYVIVGIDPLWIFRHEDYDLLLHWEHQMSPEAQPESNTWPASSRDGHDDSTSASQPGESVQP